MDEPVIKETKDASMAEALNVDAGIAVNLNVDAGANVSAADDDEKLFFMDAMRAKWDEFSLKSNAGSWLVKIIIALMIFFSLRTIVYYGLQFDKSPVSTFYTMLSSNSTALLVCEAAIAAAWLITPGLSTVLYGLTVYCALGGISPVVMAAAVLMIIFAGTEHKTVAAASMLMPALVICLTEEQWTAFFGEAADAPMFSHMLLTTSLGIFMMLVASYASIRLLGGSYCWGAFTTFATLAMSFGQFGIIYKDEGKLGFCYDKNYWNRLPNVDSLINKSFEDFVQYLMLPVVKVVAIFLLISIVYTLMLNIRLKGKRNYLDIRDAFAFVVVAALLCGAKTAITTIAGFGEGYIYSNTEIIVQTLLAYVFTRPIAGRIPTRAVTAYNGKRNFVFISYAHDDIDRVKPYLKMLTKEGYDYWYDDSIHTGDEWQGVIASNLADCSCFFAFISKASVNSEYCLKEINYATSKSKPIAVILLDDVPLPPVLEMHLASLQAVQRSKYTNDEACMKEAFELDALKKCKM